MIYRIILFLAIFMISEKNLYSQECPVNITFYTQEEIENFARDFPHCSELNKLKIGDYSRVTNITNLGPLSFLRKVAWLWVINNRELENLNGLNNLEVDNAGKLALQNNASLTDISDLKGFGPRIGQLSIVNNPLLKTLEGLNKIVTSGTSVIVRNNHSLLDISALSKLERVDYAFEFSNNPRITNFYDLRNFKAFGDGGSTSRPSIFNVSDNINLSDCSSFCYLYNNVFPNLSSQNKLNITVDYNVGACENNATLSSSCNCNSEKEQNDGLFIIDYSYPGLEIPEYLPVDVPFICRYISGICDECTSSHSLCLNELVQVRMPPDVTTFELHQWNKHRTQSTRIARGSQKENIWAIKIPKTIYRKNQSQYAFKILKKK